MGLGVSGLALLFGGGVLGGTRLARLFLGDGIATGVGPFDWLPC